MGRWSELYVQGGSLMHAVALVGAVGLVVVVERAWQLLVRYDVDAALLFPRVRARLLAGDGAGALTECERGFSAVGHVLGAGLRAGVCRVRADAAVCEAQQQVWGAMTRRVPLLSALASLSLMIGMLGTVMAMISGTMCVATTSADERASVLAQSLGMAINTTGGGLIVAIVLLSAQLYLRSVRDRLLAEVALYGAKIVNLVAVVVEPPPSTGTPYR